MDVDINIWGVLLAALAGMVIGAVWYMPQVFGKSWQKEVGLKEKDMKEGAGKAMAMAAVLSIVTAYVMAYMSYILAYFFEETLTNAGLWTAFILWIGIGFTTLGNQAAFEQRSFQWLAIVAGNLLVTLAAMGLIIGWIGV